MKANIKMEIYFERFYNKRGNLTIEIIYENDAKKII